MAGRRVRWDAEWDARFTFQQPGSEPDAYLPWGRQVWRMQVVQADDHLPTWRMQMKYRWALLGVAVLGLVVPNNMFLYATLHDPYGCGGIAKNLPASSFYAGCIPRDGMPGVFLCGTPDRACEMVLVRVAVSSGRHGVQRAALLVDEFETEAGGPELASGRTAP